MGFKCIFNFFADNVQKLREQETRFLQDPKNKNLFPEAEADLVRK